MLPFFIGLGWWMTHCPICSTDEAFVYHGPAHSCTTENWITVTGPQPWREWHPGNYYAGPYELND